MAGEKKSTGKKLLDLFWSEEPEEEKKASPGNEVKPQVLPPQINQAVIDQKVSEYLVKVFESSNLAGHDYFELKQALKAMENLPIEESAKYKAAFATLSTMGVTVDRLIETADQYVIVFNKEKEKFDLASQKQIDEKVKSKEGEMQRLTSLNEKKAEQIRQFTEEINENHKVIARLKEEVAVETTKISNTRNNFETTINNFIAQVQDDVNKIKSYLKTS